jgi:hypothetical protein
LQREFAHCPTFSGARLKNSPLAQFFGLLIDFSQLFRQLHKSL